MAKAINNTTHHLLPRTTQIYHFSAVNACVHFFDNGLSFFHHCLRNLCNIRPV